MYFFKKYIYLQNCIQQWSYQRLNEYALGITVESRIGSSNGRVEVFV